MKNKDKNESDRKERKEVMTTREFIKGPICKQTEYIGTNTENEQGGFPYHAFALDAIAIEFFGKILFSDERDLDTSGNSKKDYKEAIEELFPVKYHHLSEFLYNELRCGMLHFFGPKSRISLVREAEVKEHGEHLSVNNEGQVVLVFEDFHKDIKKAAEKLLNEEYAKLDEKFLNI